MSILNQSKRVKHPVAHFLAHWRIIQRISWRICICKKGEDEVQDFKFYDGGKPSLVTGSALVQMSIEVSLCISVKEPYFLVYFPFSFFFLSLTNLSDSSSHQCLHEQAICQQSCQQKFATALLAVSYQLLAVNSSKNLYFFHPTSGKNLI